MGRLPRLQFPGACYRVSLRGDGGDPVFLDDADRARALRLLAEAKRRFRLKLHAWCLLDSRIELALETPEGNLSRALQGFATAYTKYFNGRRRRAGHVFGGRFRSELVDKGEALAELTRRIHRIPLEAAAAPRPWRYRWSSCRAYTEGVRGATLADTEAVLAQFGKSRFRQSVKYLKFLKAEVAGCRLTVAGDNPAGYPSTISQQPSTDAPGLGAQIDLKQWVAEAAADAGVPPETVRGRLRTPAVCRARRAVARRAWDAGVKVSDIAAALRKSSAAVSKMVRVAAAAGAVSHALAPRGAIRPSP